MSNKREATTSFQHLRTAVEKVLHNHEMRERQMEMIPIALSVGLAGGSTQSANGPDDVVMVVIVGVCDRQTVREDVNRELDAALIKLEPQS